MTVNNGTYLETFYDQVRALGDKAVSSDSMIEFAGFEGMALVTKSFPWPMLSSGGEIEVPTPMGAAAWQPQQVKIHQQGQIVMQESTAGSVSNMLLQMIASGGRFDAKVYEGSTTQYKNYKNIRDCFLVTENSERDWENRSQIVTISGTLFFHYFGDVTPGNI